MNNYLLRAVLISFFPIYLVASETGSDPKCGGSISKFHHPLALSRGVTTGSWNGDKSFWEKNRFVFGVLRAGKPEWIVATVQSIVIRPAVESDIEPGMMVTEFRVVELDAGESIVLNHDDIISARPYNP